MHAPFGIMNEELDHVEISSMELSDGLTDYGAKSRFVARELTARRDGVLWASTVSTIPTILGLRWIGPSDGTITYELRP